MAVLGWILRFSVISVFGENALDTHFPTAFIDHLTESLYIWNKEFVFTLILTPLSLPSPAEQSVSLLFR